MKIATQTFGLGKEFTADLTGTIQALHDLGFQGIEPFVLFDKKQGEKQKNLWALDTLEIAWKKMKTLDMTIPSAHIDIGLGGHSVPMRLIEENILMLHERYGIECFAVSGLFDTLDIAKHWAKLTRSISNAITPHGCRILYHNHDDEFQTVHYGEQAVPAMDVFLHLAGPNVLLQMDIGWAGIAGGEVEIINRYADKIVSLHLKDFYPNYRGGAYTRINMPTEAFAPIGEGFVATKEILAECRNFPNFSGDIIIDQDQSGMDMLRALEIGCGNVRSMLAGEEA